MMKNELIENCQVLVNVNIHKTAKLSRQAFLALLHKSQSIEFAP
jgi:hypothetical protein